MKRIFSGVLLALMMNIAHAASWHLVSVDNDDQYFFIDTKSISVKRGLAEAWVQEIRVNEDGSGAVGSAKTLFKFNCEDKTIQQMFRTSYTGEEKILGTFNSPKPPVRVPPETVGEAILDFVCKKDFSGVTPIDDPKALALVYKRIAKAISERQKSEGQEK